MPGIKRQRKLLVYKKAQFSYRKEKKEKKEEASQN